MVTTKLNLSMTEPSVRQIYAKQGDTGRVLDIALDQTPEDGTLRILRPDGVEVTSEAVTGGEVESGSSFESLTEADVTELTVGIEPVQDLNGYDHPWVGGGGKNVAHNVVYASAETRFGPVITANYQIKGGKRYIFSFDTPNSGEGIYRQSPLTLGFDSFSAYSFTCDGTRKSFYGTATADATFSNCGIVLKSADDGVATGLCSNFMIEEVADDVTQPTDYAPYSNICPITGHDEVTVTDEGTNLLNYDAWKTVVVLKGTAVWENNGVTLTATGNDCYTGYNRSNFPNDAKIEVREGETITLAWDATPTYIGDAYIFPDAQTSGLVTAHSDIGHLSYTVASGVTYLTFRFGLSNSGVTASYKNIQIVRGTTVPTWTPYQGSTYTTSLGQTVYGGTLDMVTGVLTVDSRYLTVDDFTGWGGSAVSAGGLHWVNVPQTYPAGVNDDTGTNVCSHAPYTSIGSVQWQSKTPIYCVFESSMYRARMYVASASLADFKTEYATLQAVYKLAEPVTYQLTAQQIKTLVGTNNVWASSGDIVNIKFTYGGLLSELPSDATSVVGKCYCDVEQNGVSSMPFTLNVKKNERES